MRSKQTFGMTMSLTFGSFFSPTKLILFYSFKILTVAITRLKLFLANECYERYGCFVLLYVCIAGEGCRSDGLSGRVKREGQQRTQRNIPTRRRRLPFVSVVCTTRWSDSFTHITRSRSLDWIYISTVGVYAAGVYTVQDIRRGE